MSLAGSVFSRARDCAQTEPESLTKCGALCPICPRLPFLPRYPEAVYLKCRRYRETSVQHSRPMWRLMRQRLTKRLAGSVEPRRKQCFTSFAQIIQNTHPESPRNPRREEHLLVTLGHTDSLGRRTSTLAPLVLNSRYFCKRSSWDSQTDRDVCQLSMLDGDGRALDRSRICAPCICMCLRVGSPYIAYMSVLLLQ